MRGVFSLKIVPLLDSGFQAEKRNWKNDLFCCGKLWRHWNAWQKNKSYPYTTCSKMAVDEDT